MNKNRMKFTLSMSWRVQGTENWKVEASLIVQAPWGTKWTYHGESWSPSLLWCQAWVRMTCQDEEAELIALSSGFSKKPPFATLGTGTVGYPFGKVLTS